jgi:hypothetical protein
MKNIIHNIVLFFFVYCLSSTATQAQHLKVAGGNLKVNNTSLVLQNMDLVNDGTITSTDGNIVFNSGATAEVLGSGSTQFDSLTINVANGDLNLSKDVMIGSQLNFENGKLVLNDQDVTFDDPSSIQGADATNYVQTNGTGTLTRPVADADVTFPVGNSSYNPIIVNNDGGTADFYSVRVRDELLEDGTSGAQVNEYGVNRTWEIEEQTAGGSNLAVTLTWDAADEIGTTGSDYVQVRYNGSEWNTLVSGAPTTLIGLNSLTSSDNTNLGEFAIFEDRSPLTDSYICNENGALEVAGTVNSKENYHAGTVLTSDALLNASANILFTAGTSIHLELGFEVENGAYFHAFIANCTFSTTLNEIEEREEALHLNKQHELQVNIFPNPFSSETNIQFFLPESDAVQLIISDLNGRILKVQDYVEGMEGWQQTNFEAGNLPSGNYLLVVRSNGQQIVKSLVVQE